MTLSKAKQLAKELIAVIDKAEREADKPGNAERAGGIYWHALVQIRGRLRIVE